MGSATLCPPSPWRKLCDGSLPLRAYALCFSMAYVIPTQMPWSTFAGSLGRAQDALAQARRRPGHSPIRINGSPRSLVALANATDRASVHHRINPKLLGQALDLCIPLRLRQLGAEVCPLSQERGCGQSRIRAERTALTLLLQSRLTLLVGLQGTKGPNGPVAQSVGREAVVLGNLNKGLLGVLARREGLRQLLKGWNKRVHHQVPPAKHNPKLTRSPLGGSSLSPDRPFVSHAPLLSELVARFPPSQRELSCAAEFVVHRRRPTTPHRPSDPSSHSRF